jgi:lipopolysaccharide export system protein LptA
MRRTEAARYARWSAGVAVALVAITLGVYLERAVKAHIERRNAPPPPPPTVTKRSTALTFSKVEENRTLFTVRASRSTEFQGNAADLLEDVQITIFGRKGDRHDTIHTQSCQYTKGNGQIACVGEVQMDLRSAADAERGGKDPGAATSRTLHVETRGVSFDRESGLAQTTQIVKFVFAAGEGEARGVEYRSEEGVVRLQKEVKLRLKELPVRNEAGDSSGAGRELNVTGNALEFHRDSRAMQLAGPVHASSDGAELTAGELTLGLDENFNAQRIVARAAPGSSSRPELQSKKGQSSGRLLADELVAHFATGGWVTHVDGTGRVEGEITKGTAATKLVADRFTLDFTGRQGEPQQLTASGNVRAETRAPRADGSGMKVRRLQTEAVRVAFAPAERKGAARLQSAETLARGSLGWEETDGASGGIERATRLQADNLRLSFQSNGQPGEASARGNVQLQRAEAGKPEQTSASREGQAQFDEKGEWTEIVLRGEVRLREGDRRGQADTATFSQAAQTATLNGNAVASDATTRTTARAITFSQATGEIRASGKVRTSDLAARGSIVQLARVPANLSADELQANSQTGRAVYSGHARLWQGESMLEADSIELLRNSRVLNANRNVRGAFPQTAFAADGGKNRASRTAGDASTLWHVQCDSLTYRDAENQAHLDGKVYAQSAAQSLRAAAADLYFTRSEGTGAQQVSRAVATGGVTVAQGVRRATAERGEYTTADGKFVMSGGMPALYDGSGGATTGRQLTFFLTDDTIIVDTENGSRTLTKHRVEK